MYSKASIICENGFTLLGNIANNKINKHWDISDYIVLTDPPYEISENETNEIIDCAIKFNAKTVIVFSDDRQKHYPYEDMCDDYQRLYWIKPISTKNTSRHYSRFVEYIHILQWEGAIWNSKKSNWSNYVNVFTDLVGGDFEHPFQKPVSLIERLIRNHTNQDTVVVDPFFGSGTTAIASLNLGRRFIGSEQYQEYVNIATKRIVDVFGGDRVYNMEICE